jgi:hypothetical protein
MQKGMKIDNDGMMNDKYHWQKAKSEKFKFSLTQNNFNEANICLKW